MTTQGPQPGAKPPAKAIDPYLAILLYTIVGSIIVLVLKVPASGDEAGQVLVISILPAMLATYYKWGTNKDWFDVGLVYWACFVFGLITKFSLFR